MAAADGGDKLLQSAMKMAKVAIQLDGENKHKDAYCEYLRTINFISHALLEEAGSQASEGGVVVEVERMLRLAEQCLERSKSFVGQRAAPPDLPAASSRPPGQSEPRQPAPRPADAVGALPSAAAAPPPPAAASGLRRVLSDGVGELLPFLPPEVFQRLQTAEHGSTKELTPIEEASRFNQKLKANYEARLARLPPDRAHQKTSLLLQTLTQRCRRVDTLVDSSVMETLHTSAWKQDVGPSSFPA